MRKIMFSYISNNFNIEVLVFISIEIKLGIIKFTPSKFNLRNVFY